MKSRCLLISPPGERYVFPRGIMEIATFLNARGCPTRILPLGHYYKNEYPTDECGYITGRIDSQEFRDILVDEIRAADPVVVGISNTYTSDFPNCMEIIRLCKQIKPDILTVMGGQHVTFLDSESLENPELDMVIRGEGEWSLLAVINAACSGGDLLSVPGTTVRINGKAHRNPPRSFGNLQEIPPVDFGLLPEAFVKTAQINGILHRGCAYHCNYCVEKKFWRHPRPYRVAKVVAEMQTLQKEYNTQMIGFEESMLDMRHKLFFSLMSSIREAGIDLPRDFTLPTRIDTVTADGIHELKQTGINILCSGIENFSPRVLKMMNKKQDVEAITAGCRKLRAADIWLNAYWLIGHPGDTPVEAARTQAGFKDFCERRLINSGHAFIFVPYPGTDFFENPERYGIKITTYEWEKWQRWTTNPVSHLEEFPAADIEKAWVDAMQMLKSYRRLNSYLLNRHANNR
jgi:anaerobic magnesium-protoporphyrin IX monomethyl ester cyclase